MRPRPDERERLLDSCVGLRFAQLTRVRIEDGDMSLFRDTWRAESAGGVRGSSATSPAAWPRVAGSPDAGGTVEAGDQFGYILARGIFYNDFDDDFSDIPLASRKRMSARRPMPVP